MSISGGDYSLPSYVRNIGGVIYFFDANGTQRAYIDAAGTTFRLQTTNFELVSLVNQYRGRNTAGLGFAAIYAVASSTANAAAVTNVINYTPPATAGTYRLSWVVDVTTATTHNFTVVGTWKNATGAAISQNLGGFDKNGTGLVAGAITSVIGAGVYSGSVLFQVDNSATAITISTAGTFTTVAYNFAATLEQLA